MSSPYVGEIRMFAGNFAPAGWALCSGQLMAISENDTLFNLIGTTYGGDGQSTFGIPGLSGRVPIHMGNGPGGTNFQIGQTGGVETVTLTTQQIPQHNHLVVVPGAQADSQHPSNTFLGDGAGGLTQYHGAPAPATMATTSLQQQGGSQPHENMQPFLVINFILSLFGVFPTQT